MHAPASLWYRMLVVPDLSSFAHNTAPLLRVPSMSCTLMTDPASIFGEYIAQQKDPSNFSAVRACHLSTKHGLGQAFPAPRTRVRSIGYVSHDQEQVGSKFELRTFYCPPDLTTASVLLAGLIDVIEAA